MNIELVHDEDCPNVGEARSNLTAALTALKLPPLWTEIDRNNPGAKTYARQYGSPTILINSRDVSGLASQSAGNCCRIYGQGAGGLLRAPSTEMIMRSLRQELIRLERLSKFPVFTSIVSVMLSFLPTLTCPACWPTYAGALSSLGIGFFDYGPYLSLVVCALLAVSLWIMFIQLRVHKSPWPFIFAFLGAVIIMSDRALKIGPVAQYPGVVLLFAASLWSMKRMYWAATKRVRKSIVSQ